MIPIVACQPPQLRFSLVATNDRCSAEAADRNANSTCTDRLLWGFGGHRLPPLSAMNCRSVSPASLLQSGHRAARQYTAAGCSIEPP
jgi:hypothetical protein